MAPQERPPMTADDVQTIARLAHLDLSADETERMSRELGRILAYVAQLEEVDLTGVPPTAHVQLDRVALRPDEPRESLPRDVVLSEAPAVSQDGFAVPSFVDEG